VPEAVGRVGHVVALVAGAANVGPQVAVQVLAEQKLGAEILPVLVVVRHPGTGGPPIGTGRNQGAGPEPVTLAAEASGHRDFFLRQQKLDRLSGVASDAAAADGHVARDCPRLVVRAPLESRVCEEVVAGVRN